MANLDITQLWATVRKALPSRNTEGNIAPMRLNAYGDVYHQPLGLSRHAYADEGTYFVAHNATNDAATTLAGHAAPVLVDCDATMTKAFVHVICPYPSGSPLRTYLDFIEIDVITAGANGTADSWAAQIDTGATRISSGGTALTAVNPNMQSALVPVTVVTGGAVVVGVENAGARQLAHGQFRPTIQIAGDKYLFVFGGESIAANGATSIATIAHHTIGLPPVVLGPTDQFLLGLYSPSQSAAGIYKVRMGWVER